MKVFEKYVKSITKNNVTKEEVYEFTCAYQYFNLLILFIIALLIATNLYEKVVIFMNQRVTKFSKVIIMI